MLVAAESVLGTHGTAKDTEDDAAGIGEHQPPGKRVGNDIDYWKVIHS